MSATGEEARMEVELGGQTFRLTGSDGPVLRAVGVALAANGARPAEGRANLLIVAGSLLPDEAGMGTVLQTIADTGREMATGNGGRIVLLLSAVAGLPMRGHLDYSAGMAAAVAGMRGLAMELAPNVLVNAVGAGVIEDGGDLVAGDRRMLTHAGLGRAGSLADLTNAVLFLCDPLNTYTTGQLLTVDGGWSVGYGRNF